MKYILITIFTLLLYYPNAQVNLNKISASATVSGSTVNVVYTTLETLPSGFMNPINVVFKTPIATASSAVFNIGTNPYGLGYAFDFDGGDGFQYFMFQGVTAINTSAWPHPTSVTIASFTITGVSNVTLTTFGQFGSFWNGTAANLGDDNLVSWPINVNLPLPIKLSSFSAVKDGDRSARLDWTSSSEVNSAYFGVERSSDGTSWETIGKVNAAGNSSAELAYQYYDRNLPISRSNDLVFYYRLQLVDIDGKYKYSDVRGVNFKGISSTDVISLYPNPTTSMVNIDLREMDINHGTIDLKVVDMAGRYVINKTINGNGIEAVDVSRFDAGTYQVMVTQGSKQHQKRFIKVN